MSIGALAEAFDHMGLDIAADVAVRVQVENEKPPSVATLYDAARDVRDERARAAQVPMYQLPMGEELAAWPPGMVERVHEMTDPDRKRQQNEERIAAATAEWDRTREAVKALPRLRGACDGIGKPAVMADGVLVCPSCREPIADGCRPSNQAEANR